MVIFKYYVLWRQRGCVALSAISIFFFAICFAQAEEPRPSVILVFDLTNDSAAVARLKVDSVNMLGTGSVNVALPFKCMSSSQNEQGLFSIGLYQEWTLVSFNTFGTGWPQAIILNPKVERTEAAFSQSDAGRGNIFLASEGQLRRFRYRYPNSRTSDSLRGMPTGFVPRNPDAIDVDLPKGSIEVAVREGELTVPPRMTPRMRRFPAIGSDAVPFLEIAYQVPATDFQKLVVKWGAKGLGAILPLAGLAFLGRKKARHPKWRIALACIGVLCTIIVIGLIIWAALRSPDDNDAIGDTSILIITVAITGAILFVKGNDDDDGSV